MSDDLHTRIMAIVATAVTDEKSASRGVPLEMCVADHLIRELGLRPEKGQRSNSTGPLWGGDNRYTVTRYVTEWMADD